MTIAWEAPTARQDGTPLGENEIQRYVILGERLFDRKKFYFATEETHFHAPRPKQAFVIKVLCQDVNNNMGPWSEGIYYYP